MKHHSHKSLSSQAASVVNKPKMCDKPEPVAKIFPIVWIPIEMTRFCLRKKLWQTMWLHIKPSKHMYVTNKIAMFLDREMDSRSYMMPVNNAMTCLSQICKDEQLNNSKI